MIFVSAFTKSELIKKYVKVMIEYAIGLRLTQAQIILEDASWAVETNTHT